MAYTGGPLNELNGKMGISAPHKSVPVMKLIRIHKPKSKNELVQLIKNHFDKTCECGVKSQGTIEDFGSKLFESQIKYWGEYRFTLKECIQWEYDLFITQSMKGNIVEKKARQFLTHKLSGYTIEEAEGFLDEELRIDLLIKKENITKCGIQVKPGTFNKIRSEVILFNKSANEKWGKPVYYLFYDDNEVFQNIDQVIKEIWKI
ncbi:MAG: MjaI family restriction endonuclease [Calditrichaeota bacterium]|nr:MAG: MjaI family restriction endonuclease [Calditrichota bacterium]MBL1203941.1 MjaI family restriction endonuclease [Calditrichota bacterium]NOG43772.1 MjaI family restriction endonuclease [Calditrichota bacterium]